MAIMGLSAQSSPFKPSYFWFCHSCPRSSALVSWPSSRFFKASSKRPLRSREDCTLWGPNGTLSCVAGLGGNQQFKQSTTYSTMPLSENPRSDEVDCDNSYSHWSSVIHTEMRRPTLSSRMLPSHQKKMNFDYSIGHHITWLEESDRMRKMKMTVSGKTENVIVEAKVKGLADRSAYECSQISSSSCSLGIDDSVRKGALQKLCEKGHTDVGQVNRLTFKRTHDPRIQKPIFDAKNGGFVRKVVDESLRANFFNGKNKNLKLDENHSIGIEERSAAMDDVNGTYIEPLSIKQAGNIDQPLLCENLRCIYDNVLIVDNISTAKDVVAMLTNQYRRLVHACDTEVSNIDAKQETPVDHGEIICFSIYSGPKANFGNGKSCIWIDVLDGGRSLLAEFAPFFEDPSIKKVWHNYSFDNHVIENYGIKVSGFHADTMHMARLWDSSRRTVGGYSLEALTGDPSVMSRARSWPDRKLIGKISMKTIFGRRKEKKDGSEGKIITVPPVEELQRQERVPWIGYSALDSISTLDLYESLKNKLSSRDWYLDGRKEGTMFDFYEAYWHPFGDLLVKMETEGMLVNRAYLAHIEKVAKAEQQVAADRFRNWASKYCPDAKCMNVGSDAQLRQLFFGGIQNRKTDEYLPVERDFKVPNADQVIEEGKKTPSKYRKITLRSLGVDIETEMYTASGWPSVSGDALKTLAGKVSAELEIASEDHQSQSDDSIEELPHLMSNKYLEVKGAAVSVAGEVKKKREGTPVKSPELSAYGTAYTAFGGGRKGMEACHAISALCEVCTIDSLISNFILPLQGSHVSGRNGRIHCSLNINTETGRLSARRPNLQNQPALEKDRYKIRQAFVASPGNSLIVADYGQLELRILAHLANCKSMLDAFSAGGDFHSRTAMNMYPYIREAVEQKHVLLEWHPQPGEEKPPVPLLKDTYASERRKAKMLNFSIAYGKTAVGLARDWKVSVKEAKATVDRWYSDRQEVLKWQYKRKEEARRYRCVHTLLGRARWFPSVEHATPGQKGHIERAAINTPVQGSAADVTMCAMLEILENERLSELGWRLLLQVHDEVILEGPVESAEEAKAIVIDCMSKPFNGTNILRVGLSVDAKCAQNWYAAK